MKRAVYAGSFDPLTLGHLDILRRGAGLFDELVVAIGHNVRKQRFLSLEVRTEVLRASVSMIPNTRVDTFEGLLVDYCRRIDATVILRGLRGSADLELELPTGLANREMAPGIETLFLLAEPRLAFVSSSLMKEIAVSGGDASAWLPPAAWAAVQERVKAG